MKTAKPIYKSKVMWFNALSGLVQVAQTVSPFLGPHGIAIAGGVTVVGNIILRFMTNGPIATGDKA